MLSRKFLIPAILGHRHITSSCCLQKAGGQLSKQVHMLKKIMAGREKGRRRFVYNENLPKLENVKKMSDTKGQGKESNRRITVLNKLFMKNITDLMATDKFARDISGYGLQISCVKVSPDFNSLNVFWLAQGDENDLKVEQILKSMAGFIRHELSQLRLMGEVPRIFFVKDKHYSKAAEIDILLKRADFGEDFVPTDPTLFMKSDPQLQMKLSDDIRSRIHEIEQNLDDDEELFEDEELPEMRNDVLGIDHSLIMKKIATSMDKSKKAWETFETRSETILADGSPTKNFTAAQLEIDKFAKEADLRDDFVRFLERKQFAKRETPERKKHRNHFPHEDPNDVEEYRDPVPDGDFLEDDHEVKK